MSTPVSGSGRRRSAPGAQRTAILGESLIREMLRLASHDPANLAHGLPNLPAPDEVKQAASHAIERDDDHQAVTWGTPELRPAIAASAVIATNPHNPTGRVFGRVELQRSRRRVASTISFPGQESTGVATAERHEAAARRLGVPPARDAPGPGAAGPDATAVFAQRRECQRKETGRHAEVHVLRGGET